MVLAYRNLLKLLNKCDYGNLLKRTSNLKYCLLHMYNYGLSKTIRIYYFKNLKVELVD